MSNNSITTVSGKFYVGMTREDAEKQNLTTKSFSEKLASGPNRKIIFDEVDTNKNGVLELSEICDRRDFEVEEKKDLLDNLKLLSSVGTVAVAAGLCGTGVWALAALMYSVGAAIVGFSTDDGHSEQVKTNNYRAGNIDINS